MYGMVNNAIIQYLKNEHGVETLNKICETLGYNPNFSRMEQYDDSVSVNLILEIAKHANQSPAVVLENVGEFWIEYAKNSEYGSFLEMAGSTIPEILGNLDSMHVRVGESFSELSPPSFHCSEIGEKTLKLHYTSKREGLEHMVIGLVRGLGRMLNQESSAELIEDKPNEKVFLVHF